MELLSPLHRDVMAKYRGQSFADLPFSSMRQGDSFRKPEGMPDERVIALAAIAGEKLGKRFSCCMDDGGITILCSADFSDAKQVMDSACDDIRKNGALVLVLTEEEVAKRKQQSLPIYPFRNLKPGDYFEVTDRRRQASARSGANDIQNRVAGVAFRSAVTDSGSLVIQRIDMEKIDLSMLGRRGRPSKKPATTGKFLGTFEYGSSRYPFRELQVGDWFCVTNPGESFRANCASRASRVGIRVSVHRKTGSMLVVRVQ
jgi:hypothetical protein